MILYEDISKFYSVLAKVLMGFDRKMNKAVLLHMIYLFFVVN